MIKGYNQKLEFLARHDSLTKLQNRSAFNDSMHDFILLAKRELTPLSLIFFDIDNFKHINDTLSHQSGDAVLVRIAEILRNRLRRTDIVGRWGGEEFTVGLINTDLENAQIIAETLRQSFEEDAVLFHLCGFSVTASFGVVTLSPTDSIDTLLSRADTAMYRAKDLGKNRVETTHF
jgi:diguanylate cyclase (GGDEF)-like protein